MELLYLLHPEGTLPLVHVLGGGIQLTICVQESVASSLEGMNLYEECSGGQGEYRPYTRGGQIPCLSGKTWRGNGNDDEKVTGKGETRLRRVNNSG